MMRNLLLAGAAFAVLAAATPALAQDAPPPPPPGHGRPGMGGPGGPGMRHEHPPLTRADAEKAVADAFARLDANHDGVLTTQEIAAARDARRAEMRTAMEARIKELRDREFDRLDTNHDGTISRAEFAAITAPPPPGAGPNGAPPPGAPRMAGRGPMHGPDHGPMRGPMGGSGMMMADRWFDRLVEDHAGKVTLAEAKAAALARFDRLDTNHDGTISREERRMAFRGMMRHGPGRWGAPGWGAPPPPPEKG